MAAQGIGKTTPKIDVRNVLGVAGLILGIRFPKPLFFWLSMLSLSLCLTLENVTDFFHPNFALSSWVCQNKMLRRRAPCSWCSAAPDRSFPFKFKWINLSLPSLISTGTNQFQPIQLTRSLLKSQSPAIVEVIRCQTWKTRYLTLSPLSLYFLCFLLSYWFFIFSLPVCECVVDYCLFVSSLLHFSLSRSSRYFSFSFCFLPSSLVVCHVWNECL